jgi:hypothetical protein
VANRLLVVTVAKTLTACATERACCLFEGYDGAGTALPPHADVTMGAIMKVSTARQNTDKLQRKRAQSSMINSATTPASLLSDISLERDDALRSVYFLSFFYLCG